MASLVHVSRNGTPLGQFRRDLIASMIEAGTLLPEDLYYDDHSRTWMRLSDLRQPERFVPAGREAPGEVESEEAAEEGNGSERRGGSRRRRRRSGSDSGPRKPRRRNPAESSLPGWITALFAICIAAGLWAWSQSLGDSLRLATQKIQELEAALKALQKQNTILLEMSPPFTTRGIMTNEPSPGRLAILSGVSVSAYRLDDVRSAIMRIANLPPPINEEEFASLVTSFQSALPPPLAMTLSDSSGRFEISIPEMGDYALVATAFKQGGGSNERLLWIVQFDSRNEPTPVLSLSEANAVMVRTPAFKITPARR
jgi:hypothetical protein